ncbi:ATP-dependent DNA ligase [Candidatus Parcubacteria bacterium]|nr:MAG: ATP-dependent DNA ligase [Candidatus Parcubacteria bacterium]
MEFSEFAAALERLEATSSRNERTALLATLLKKTRPEEIAAASYLLLGELVPAYRGIEFNMAEKLMINAVAAAFDVEPAAVAARFRAKGDLGDAAEELAARRGPGHAKRHTVADVYAALLKLAEYGGAGSQERRVRGMGALIGGLDPRSVKFVARIPLGKLRLGFSDATLLDALSIMAAGDKSARPAIEAAYNVTADIGAIAERVRRGGLAAIRRIGPKPGIPIRASLAERLRSLEDIILKVGPIVGVEQKLDGIRTQVHVWRDRGTKRVELFSRNLENITAMFPEIVAAAERLNVRDAILDGEAIGYNPRTNTFAPFQETVQRKRKHDVAAFSKKIPIAVFVFDILYRNGESLLARPFRERRRELEKLLPRPVGAMHLAGAEETDVLEPIQRALDASIAAGLEGLVVKNMEAPYEAGKRGFHWIKIKGASALASLRGGAVKASTQLLDTVDTVVMGIYRGRGKRAKFGVGGLLLGVRGADDRFYSISRLGTGLSDEQFREVHERAAKLGVRERPADYVVDAGVTPDIWLRPSLVTEILADEITRSPNHTAGRTADGRGYSLRFPRLVRFRDDKGPADATTVTEIAAMHKQQKVGSLKRRR